MSVIVFFKESVLEKDFVNPFSASLITSSMVSKSPKDPLINWYFTHLHMLVSMNFHTSRAKGK